IRDSRGVIVNGFLLDGSTRGSAEEGGSVEVFSSEDVTISASQILNSAYRGVYVADSRNVRISGNTIRGKSADGTPVAAVAVTGKSRNAIVRDNLTDAGAAGEILAEPGT